jgi:hypothetical protein
VRRDKSDSPKDAAIYRDVFLARIRQIARECGYAVGVHGSEIRDLDLIAVPWTLDATSADDLRIALIDGLPAVYLDADTKKPHGRVGYILAIEDERNIDLSVMPRAAS